METHRKTIIVYILTASILPLCALVSIISMIETSSSAQNNTPSVSNNTISIPNYAEYIDLCDYNGIKYTIPAEYNYTEDDINELFEEEKKETFSATTKLQDITDRGAEERDIADITYSAKWKDGTPIDTISSDNVKETITVGYAPYGEGFNSGILNMKTGDHKTITTYYNNGKKSGDAEFIVTMNALKKYIIPEVTDESVKEYTDYETYDEYEKETKNKLRTAYIDMSRDVAINEIIKEIVKNSNIKGYPEEYIDKIIQYDINDVIQNANKLNISEDEYIKTYMAGTGANNMDEYKQHLTDQAKTYLIKRMTACEVARKENIKITEEDIENYKQELRNYYNLDAGEDVLQYVSNDDIMFHVLLEKLAPILFSKAEGSYAQTKN